MRAAAYTDGAERQAPARKQQQELAMRAALVAGGAVQVVRALTAVRGAVVHSAVACGAAVVPAGGVTSPAVTIPAGARGAGTALYTLVQTARAAIGITARMHPLAGLGVGVLAASLSHIAPPPGHVGRLASAAAPALSLTPPGGAQAAAAVAHIASGGRLVGRVVGGAVGRTCTVLTTVIFAYRGGLVRGAVGAAVGAAVALFV